MREVKYTNTQTVNRDCNVYGRGPGFERFPMPIRNRARPISYEAYT